MCNTTEGAPALDRNTVSNLNPFVGITTAETLHFCTGVVSDLGYLVSVDERMGLQTNWPQLFRVFEAITIALRYEEAQLNQQKGTQIVRTHQNKEESHV